jgi:T5orf172 domain
MPEFVYVIAVGGDDGPFEMPVKIGITANPAARLGDLRPCSPLGISFAFLQQVPDRKTAVFLEKEAHKIFDRWRLNYEWFAVEPFVAARLLESLVEKMGR